MYEKYITTPAWKLGREMYLVSPVALGEMARVVGFGKCANVCTLCVWEGGGG